MNELVDSRRYVSLSLLFTVELRLLFETHARVRDCGVIYSRVANPRRKQSSVIPSER